jgi:pimeloyl-ACP methyl ester carboxylesterase
MRVFFFALIAVALGAQEPPKEAAVSVAGGELKYLYAAGSGAPLMVVLPGGMDEPAVRKLFSQWQPLAASRGWNCAMPFGAGVSDGMVKALESIVADVKKRLPKVDETRVYLVGPGASAAEVFYALSRAPDLWAAGLAVQGSPAQAINSYHLFGANTQAAPLLWIAPAAEVDPVRQKLSAAEFNFATRPEANANEALDWLSKQQRPLFPATVDCETGSPAFARCYWIEMTKFDPKKRNDVLKSTRVLPGSGASLAFGPFGYDPQSPGPGVLVGWLPADYKGPLKLNDRLVSVAGKDVRDGRDYAEQMDEIKEEKPVAVVVQRGKERVRLETKILLPKRDELITARVQGRYLPDQKELLLISRTVTQMRVRIPAEWTPVSVSWNGLDLLKAESAGCWVLNIDPPEASKCP